jgi:hypothetical protein
MSLGDTTKLYDALVFVDSPPPTEISQPSQWPFTVQISAGDVGEHYIDLYAQYSRSYPYKIPQTRWSHLIPQWRFTDVEGRFITKLKTTDTTITDSSGNSIGVTGSAQFYYIDDMPTLGWETPVMIWATMSVSGRDVFYDIEDKELASYANSMTIKGEPVIINGKPPTYLDISADGIRDINKIKWVDTPFRYTILAKADRIPNMCSGSPSGVTIFDYPQEGSDLFASTHPINRTILGVPASSETWVDETVYFEREDSNTGLHTGGYQIGSIESTDAISNTQISATVSIQPSAGWYRDTPYLWVSNHEEERINKITSPFRPLTATDYINPLLPTVQSYTYTGITEHTLSAYQTSGIEGGEYWSGGALTTDTFGGIYGMAVSPCYQLWAVDPELDKLFNFSVLGEMLTAIDIAPSGASPQAITFDGNGDKWITLYGSTSTVKYDANGEYTGIAAIPPYTITDVFDSASQDPDSILVRPVDVETDIDNNIWVTYEHALSSMLIKYDTNGSYITSCNLPVSSQPQSLVLDFIDESIWVGNTYEILVDPYTWEYAASGGSIQHFTSAGELIETYPNLLHPAYMTIDNDRKLWFAFGHSGLGLISGGEVHKFWLSGGNITPYDSTHIAIDNSQLGLNDRLKGVGVDSRNTVWVVDAYESIVYAINVSNINDYMTFDILPKNDETDVKIQAYGDWTGNRWIQKYINSSHERQIHGVSNLFDIHEFNDEYSIRRFNESWNTSEQMRDYALSDHIYNNEALFNQYLSGMVGGIDNNSQSIGRKSYERIANFVANHSDISVCGIDQLYSLSNELDVPINQYNISFPNEIKRLLDIVSIPHQKLWGERCKCNTNFNYSNTCKVCNHSHCLNRSQEPISPNTYMFTSGDYVVVRRKLGSNNYEKLPLPDTANGSSTFAISAVPSMAWLTSSNYAEYNFYTYIPTTCDTQVEGVINWDDDYTTLSENNSALSAWYVDNEIVDHILTEQLYRGLSL